MITVKGFRQAKGTLAEKIVNKLFDEGITIKSSSVPHALEDYDDHSLEIYSSSDSVDASNSVEPVVINTTMSGAGGVGGRVRVGLTIADEIALGGWANAFKASVDCGSNGYATGLLSVGNFEIDMPSAGAGGGTTAVIEMNITSGSGWTGGSPVDILYFNNSGDGKAAFDTNGYLMQLDGLTEAAGKIFRVAAPGTLAASLRCKVAGTTYYLPLYTAQN